MSQLKAFSAFLSKYREGFLTGFSSYSINIWCPDILERFCFTWGEMLLLHVATGLLSVETHCRSLQVIVVLGRLIDHLWMRTNWLGFCHSCFHKLWNRSIKLQTHSRRPGVVRHKKMIFLWQVPKVPKSNNNIAWLISLFGPHLPTELCPFQAWNSG